MNIFIFFFCNINTDMGRVNSFFILNASHTAKNCLSFLIKRRYSCRHLCVWSYLLCTNRFHFFSLSVFIRFSNIVTNNTLLLFFFTRVYNQLSISGCVSGHIEFYNLRQSFYMVHRYFSRGPCWTAATVSWMSRMS